MKAFKTLISIAVLAISITGCTTIKQLGYFQVDPYAKPLDTKIEVPITIVLMDDVKDSLTVWGVGVKSMDVSDFRRSVAVSIENTVGRNFDNVIIADKKPDNGLVLVIYRVRPFWFINSRSSSTQGTGDNVYSTTKALIAAAFQYETSLFYNGEKLSDADSTIHSDDQMSVIGQAHYVFKSGVTKMCETIYRDLFTNDVIRKITMTR
jgi:hypothetical protein